MSDPSYVTVDELYKELFGDEAYDVSTKIFIKYISNAPESVDSIKGTRGKWFNLKGPYATDKTGNKPGYESNDVEIESHDNSQRERDNMDWQERYIEKMDHDFREMKDSLRATEDRIAINIEQTMTEMRDRDKQRHEEVLALRKDFNSAKLWLIGIVISIVAMAIATIIGISNMVTSMLMFFPNSP